MSSTSMQFKSTKLALSMALVATLAACGGGTEGVPTPAPVLAAPVVAPVSTTNAKAATAVLTSAKDVSFASGVPALGTTAATTLSFSAPAAGSADVPFTMTSGGVTSKGNLKFGSCIFTITERPVGTVLNPAIVLPTVPTEQCKITVGTDSKVTFTLLSATSGTVAAPVVVQPDGTVQVSGETIGKGSVVTGAQ